MMMGMPQLLFESLTVVLLETNGKSCGYLFSSPKFYNFPSFYNSRCYKGTGTSSCSDLHSQYERLCACSILP